MFTLLTANSMMIGSFTFSLRLRRVTVSDTSEPAGIIAPLEPETASFTVAVITSPTLLVFVHVCEFARRLSDAPAAIVPVLAEAPVPLVTVLPLAVLVGVVDFVEVFVPDPLVAVLVVPLVFELPAGTSVRAGWAAVSLPAIARSRFSVESDASALSDFDLS